MTTKIVYRWISRNGNVMVLYIKDKEGVVREGEGYYYKYMSL